MKAIIYILSTLGLFLIGLFFKELGIISIIFSYLFGIGVGFVIWDKKINIISK